MTVYGIHFFQYSGEELGVKLYTGTLAQCEQFCTLPDPIGYDEMLIQDNDGGTIKRILTATAGQEQTIEDLRAKYEKKAGILKAKSEMWDDAPEIEEKYYQDYLRTDMALNIVTETKAYDNKIKELTEEMADCTTWESLYKKHLTLKYLQRGRSYRWGRGLL